MRLWSVVLYVSQCYINVKEVTLYGAFKQKAQSMKSSFRRLSLSKQFLIVSFPVILLGSLAIGWWIGNQVKESVLQRMGSVVALFVDSYIAPQMQILSKQTELSAEQIADLNKDIKKTMLDQKIVSLKIWNKHGRVLFSTDPSVIGKTLHIEEALVAAFDGKITSDIDIRTIADQIKHGQPMPRLIETYTPIHENRTGRVIASAELYQQPDEIDRLAYAAQLNSWTWVGSIMSLMYLCLFMLVRRGSKTIEDQREELNKKISELTKLNEQNIQLQERVIKAAERTTRLNEDFLQRVSTDIHDGPGQDLGFALMQIKNLDDTLIESQTSGQPIPAEWSSGLKQTKAAIQSAVKDLRALSDNIELPDIALLSIDAIAERVVRDHLIKTGVVVELVITKQNVPASFREKVAVYRLLQESLANAYKHAHNTACRVSLKTIVKALLVDISDKGPGFDPQFVLKKKRLGLAGMRHRIEVLGGSFQLITTIGVGTTILVTLPLLAMEVDNE
jgi:signal transduction histidine kinase